MAESSRRRPIDLALLALGPLLAAAYAAVNHAAIRAGGGRRSPAPSGRAARSTPAR
ncbi:hypothetical protein [Nonomuraea sp. B1E8]|uniref:hypothetical protein n=1 Tax=unclassified Nonomuraea TaxID=2593643 RepID=UPI00325C93D4